ncbi:MAG: fused MFS/spermidine synthase, partial [Planctomycetes bacterium]|nr:fused MFS/spermidine synthase [Planctomycetota bacterium]
MDKDKRGLLPGMITTGCAFAGGFIIMVLEIVGVRYLVMDFGGSFYVWISQIGVIMIALSLGYYLGGALADRFQRAAFLTLLLIPTGIGTALIPKFSGGIVNWIIMRHPADESIPLIWQKLDPAFGSALIFLSPCLVLGMLSPYMVRLAATRLSHVGRVSGTCYAASTRGSVTGVFVSGYVLINLMRLSHIFYLSGGLICLLGVMCLFMDRWLDQGNTEWSNTLRIESLDEGKRGLLPGMITTGCAFAGGFIIMVLEIVGVRYLDKDFAGSFYVWISQIGVIMIAL